MDKLIILIYTSIPQSSTTPSMKSIILTISLCLSICTHTQSQTYISPEEMCYGYVKQYLNKEKLPTLEDLDIVYFVYNDETDAFKKENDDSHYLYMQQCPTLRTACGFILPPSIYVATIRSWNDTDDAKLYWIGLRDSSATGDYQKLKDALKGKYGSTMMGTHCEAIPAKWFAGDIFAQSKPVLHGGNYMSCYQTLRIHIADDQDTDKSNVVKYTKPKGKMYSDFVDIMCLWRHGNRASYAKGRALSQEDRAEGAIHLLSRDLRDIMIKNKSIKDKTIKLYNLVLMHDEKGNTIAQPVSQESLSPDDRTRIKKLNAALKRLPSHSIGDTYTLDGRLYPGACVDATYDNGLWWMELAKPAWE